MDRRLVLLVPLTFEYYQNYVKIFTKYNLDILKLNQKVFTQYSFCKINVFARYS